MGIWGWWAFDVFTLMASYLGSDVMGAQTIMRTIGLFTFMIPVGLASSVGTLTGNMVGAGKPEMAVRYYYIALGLGVIISMFQILVLVVGRVEITAFFTDDETVAAQMYLAWPILNCYVIFDTLQAEGMSVIRGTGNQRLGSIMTMSAYWVFGLPLSAIACFYWDFGITGIWFGPTFAVFYLSVVYNIIIRRINWDELVQKAKERRVKEQENREALKVRALAREATKEGFERN